MDIIFDMIITKKSYASAETLTDFVELLSAKLMPLIDVDKENGIELLFVERVSISSFLVLSKDKNGLDLEDKELVIFLIETEE